MDDDAKTLKGALRARLAAQRIARTASERALLDAALTARADRCQAASIAAFVPTHGEPGSLAVLDALAERARVLLPLTDIAGRALSWGDYGGSHTLVPGPFGVPQPPAVTGTLDEVEIVLVPAVAIGLDGSRLGHGGGFYDRALTGLPRERLVGVVHDDEVLESLPAEAHDVRVGWLCTPSRLLRLPG